MNRIMIWSVALLYIVFTSGVQAQISQEGSLFASIAGSSQLFGVQIDYSGGEYKVGIHDLNLLNVFEGLHQPEMTIILSKARAPKLARKSLDVEAFPNPFSTYLQISSAEALSSVDLMDSLGKVVAQGRSHDQLTWDVNFDEGPPGMYFLRCRSAVDESILSIKVIKTR